MSFIKRVHLWMIAIRDSFITLLPVTFLGVIAVLIKDFPLPLYQSMMAGKGGGVWQELLQLIIDASHGVFSLLLCALVAGHVARSLKRPESEMLPYILVAISGLTNFMILTLAQGPLVLDSLGHSSILIAIAVGIFSAEAFRWAVEARWLNLARMPYDTEAVFYHAIKLALPFIFVGLAVAVISFGIERLPDVPLSPFQSLTETVKSHGGSEWWLSGIATLVNQVVWFLGSHGGHILDTYASSLFSAPGEAYDGILVWRPMFDAFVLLGGSGATIGLILAIIIVVKEGPSRKVAQLSVLPGIFNINETVLYGLPLVLNPAYLLPFIGLPLLLGLLTLTAGHVGFLEFKDVAVPWTTPPIISGWMLTGSWHGAVFQVAEICLSTALYLPIVKKIEAKRMREQSHKLAETTNAILSEGRAILPVMHRDDEIGLMARGLLSDLRTGLNSNALKLKYQPKHALDGRVVGVEALIRWQHQRFGQLSPAVAILLAEDSGDIHSLGWWVIEQACACKARWNEQGFKQVVMAVNVSPPQLTDDKFVARMEALLEKHCLDPGEIELELTETLHIPNTYVVDEALRGLSRLGVRLAMDDFGMGYTSLLHLRRFHFHTIKIDGSLTRDVLSNSICADIIRTIAELGRAQKIDVIAEFVETKAQRALLAELGCNYFQGYYHSPAIAEDECLEYFKEALDKSS